MTAPNFLAHIQHTGFAPQPGIGDILGQQFQNLAQTRSVVREQNQRQQQIDQLGQYYQGQVHEMQRLRDQQEAAARLQQQRAIQRQQILARHPPQPNETPEQAVQRLKLMLPDLVQIGDESVGSIVELLKSIGVDKPRTVEAVDPEKDIIDPQTGAVIRKGTPKAAEPPKEERPMGVSPGSYVIDPKTGKVIFHAPDRPGSGGGGGAQENRDMIREERIRSNWEQVTKVHATRADQLGAIAGSVDGARQQNPASQMAMIFSFMKVLDPTSAVREREYANAQNAAGVPERVRNVYNKLLKGTILTPQQIENFYKEAQAQGRAGAKEVRRQREAFRKQAQRWRVNEDILIDPYGALVPEDDADDAAKAAAVDKLIPK